MQFDKSATPPATLNISAESVNFWRQGFQVQGANFVLKAVLLELLGHIGMDQLVAFCYAVGRRVAADFPLGPVETLAEFESVAGRFLTEKGWGWLRIEEKADFMDFVHGCAPLRTWFGDRDFDWASSFLEGFYAEWLKQVGGDDQLELRLVDGPVGEDMVLRFRLMHSSRFGPK